jgi:hypothetical protein
VTTTSASIRHHWGTIFTYKLANIVNESLVPGAPALPLDLTKSPLGIIDWTAFSVKADLKTDLEGEEFKIDVIYKRASFDLGGVTYPEETIPVSNRGNLQKDPLADATYKLAFSYWRTESP